MNNHDCFVLRRRNRHLKREAFPLFFSRSMAFFLDHRSTKLIIPESYDLSTCSSCTFNPALPLSPVRRHSVLYGHSKQGAGVCLKPSSPRGNTISSFPKQSSVLFSEWAIGCWLLGTGFWCLVTGHWSPVAYYLATGFRCLFFL